MLKRICRSAVYGIFCLSELFLMIHRHLSNKSTVLNLPLPSFSLSEYSIEIVQYCYLPYLIPGVEPSHCFVCVQMSNFNKSVMWWIIILWKKVCSWNPPSHFWSIYQGNSVVLQNVGNKYGQMLNIWMFWGGSLWCSDFLNQRSLISTYWKTTFVTVWNQKRLLCLLWLNVFGRYMSPYTGRMLEGCAVCYRPQSENLLFYRWFSARSAPVASDDSSVR